jgi:hypothetical protein
MWRAYIYKQLEYILPRDGNRRYIVRDEEEIDNGQYISEQESGLFGRSDIEEGVIYEFPGSDERNDGVQRRSLFGENSDKLFEEQQYSGIGGRRCGSDRDVASICEGSARIFISRGIYGSSTDNPRIAGRIVERIRAGLRKQEIVRSVAFFNSVRQLSTILETLCEKQAARKGPGVRIIAIHWENDIHTQGHIHILHDCNPNHGSYRCAFLKGIGPVHHAKGTKYTLDFTEHDIIRVLYFCMEERQLTHIFIDEELPYLLKLRCYKVSDIKGVPERDQWKKSYTDMTLHFGHQSDVHRLLGNLFQGATKEVLEGVDQCW